RRRHCPSCTSRFTTFERVQIRELTVIKSDASREAFDREKLAKSLLVALRKRPVDPERAERAISHIVRSLESINEPEISSSLVGQKVMEALAALDPVAYVRFASVHRNFREIADFKRFVGSMERAYFS
ncbi:MAG: transcriptional regulator NrdR, partial [Alphaproteobacteria bacterium]